MQTQHPHRKDRISEELAHAAAKFIQQESNTNPMITVTHAELSQDFKNATVFVTVFPEDQEELSMDFLRRNVKDFRDFLKNETRLQHLPWLSFEIDGGEKSRQKIDKIIQRVHKDE
jgi:ribosome-binding factor A